MCSRKCDTPATSADSSRLPALTKNPEATDRAWSFSSAITWRPLSRTVWWNCIERPPRRMERGARHIGTTHHRGGFTAEGARRGDPRTERTIITEVFERSRQGERVGPE